MKIIYSFFLQSSLVIFVVGTLTFVMSWVLPGDIAYRVAAGRYGHDMVDTAAAESVRQELGLDQSVAARYWDWLADLATWDFGVSLVSGAKITTTLVHEFGSTLTLALTAVLLSALIGPPIGVYLAVSKSKSAEKASVAMSVAMRSVPSYVIGIMLILLFSVGLGWLPAAGCGAPVNYVLPSMTLALPLAVVSIRITRASLASVMSSAYYEFSQLKGLRWFQSLWAHGLRNMAIPVIAYHGVQLIYLIEGLVIVETLFAWPGIGHSMVHAVFARDIPMLQGTAMTLALSFVFVNTLLDVVYRWVDPRGAST